MKARLGATRASVIVASLGISVGVLAQGMQTDAYVTDVAGRIVKSPNGPCWRTSLWTPAKAIAECDPDLIPKPAPVRVETPPPPPPVAAPAPEPAVAAPAVAAEPPKAAPVPKPARIERITLGADASFDTGKSDLKPEGKASLDGLAAKLRDVQIESMVVTGHTDSVGSDAANQKLSLRRAEAVKAQLVSLGMVGGKIQTVGRGKSNPVADNKTAQGRARNRRVEVDVKGARTGP
jgi:OOP family OmpA-OmpF porin